MADSQIQAVRYPEPWPPPLGAEHSPHPYAPIPVVGYIFNYLYKRHLHRQHRKEVLDPIADAIAVQLEHRPTESDWPSHPVQKQIAKYISDAVCLEKGLTNSPALHPDDPFPLLFWGPFDDITPAIVRMKCRNELDLTMPDSLFIKAWEDRWTIEVFIEQSLAI